MQLCVSDVQEDLMDAMSLTAESEKPLSSQESEGQQSGGPASESLQGETATSHVSLTANTDVSM